MNSRTRIGDSVGMFFCCRIATISGESDFIALPYCRPSVSQPASATTAANATELVRTLTYRENRNPMLPDPLPLPNGRGRPALRIRYRYP